MLHSRSDLQRMRAAVDAKAQPISAGFEKLRDHPQSQLSYVSKGAFAEIARNPNNHSGEFDSDSNAAYQCALMGAITGNPAFFNLTARLIDGWSSTLERITGLDAILCASLGGFKMANAAELLRYSSSVWPEEKTAACARMLRKVFLPVIVNFAGFANGNWDTGALKLMIAIAIFTDDRELLARALTYYCHGNGDGQLAHYIYPGGECQESGRDQAHTQLGMAHLGDCCEMAWHQGLDLYGALDNRLLAGFEYTAGYNLGEQVRFVPDHDRTGNYFHPAISPRGPLRPVYEQIYNHYVKRRGIPAPWTQKAAESLRPEGAFINSDHTGFGTLLYSREAGPDTAEAAGFAAIADLHADGSTGGVSLDWTPFAAAARYQVWRADELSGFHLLKSDLTDAGFLDSGLKAGRQYRYLVNAADAPQRGMAQTQVAGLPNDWSAATLGSLPVQGAASCPDGTSFRLSAAGSGLVEQAKPFFFVHHALPGDGVLTAILQPLIASQYLRVGLALRGGLELGSPGTMLLLAPNGSNGSNLKHLDWAVSHWQRQTDQTELKPLGQQTLAAPFVENRRIMRAISLRIERKANIATASYGDGKTWTTLGTSTLPRGALRAGLFLSSNLGEMPTEVYFDAVSLTA